MTRPASQELLPPERPASADSSQEPSMLRWLVEPLQDRMFLPLAGLWILGLDWLLFPPEGATLMLATPVASLLGFIFGSTGVFQMQRRFTTDSKRQALLKAVVAGVIVGMPFPIAGSVIGGWILATSGLIHLKERFFRR